MTTATKRRETVVIGGSRGVGRAIVDRASTSGDRVLAVGRHRGSLDELARDRPGVATLSLDMTDDDAPERLFARVVPDLLVVAAGAIMPTAPVHRLSFAEFSVNWESDVRGSFAFVKAALLRPLPPGAVLVLISSGAGVGGSPISGGYAGAKRMQMFLAQYAQREADRERLGLRFHAVAPGRIMPETRLGRIAVDGYVRDLGTTERDFLAGMVAAQSASDVATAVLALADGDEPGGGTWQVTAAGTERVP